jgi:hypothetical protein
MFKSNVFFTNFAIAKDHVVELPHAVLAESFTEASELVSKFENDSVKLTELKLVIANGNILKGEK